MVKYQIWGFVYIADKNGTNVITGNDCESSVEFNIPCFNGLSFFKVNGKSYVIRYPRIQSLTSQQKEDIEIYCGYEPMAGEYGVIAGSLGEVSECSNDLYESLCNTYPIKHKDKVKLGYCE